MKVKILAWDEMLKLPNVKKLYNGDLEYRIENDDDEIDDSDYVSWFTVIMEDNLPPDRIIETFGWGWNVKNTGIIFNISYWMIDKTYKGE
jgi:hypothetical protein